VQLQLYRGLLTAVTAPSAAGALACELLPPQVLNLSQAGVLALPAWGGHFAITQVQSEGTPPELLRAVSTAARLGGERLRLAPRAAARSLKKQFQACAVPAWQRDGPLLYTADGRLLFVPGLGLCGSLWAEPGTLQLGVQWVPDAAPACPAPTARRQRGS
jgi:tRNA(Ile)-lysidine synthase